VTSALKDHLRAALRSQFWRRIGGRIIDARDTVKASAGRAGHATGVVTLRRSAPDFQTQKEGVDGMRQFGTGEIRLIILPAALKTGR